tara:strand:+ start:600 stop:761 length:162 start_codon:yes stop_codon:yes gene_type:complete
MYKCFTQNDWDWGGDWYDVQKFIHYLHTIPDIWITRRIDIAQYWLKNHKPQDQ